MSNAFEGCELRCDNGDTGCVLRSLIVGLTETAEQLSDLGLEQNDSHLATLQAVHAALVRACRDYAKTDTAIHALEGLDF
jgi:hypothetical protein